MWNVYAHKYFRNKQVKLSTFDRVLVIVSHRVQKNNE